MVESNEVMLLPCAANRSSQTQTEEDGIVKPLLVLMPSNSGKGQLVARCPVCFVAVWSHYAGSGPALSFVRGGAIDKTSVDGSSIRELLRPDMFIFTKHKQPWVVYPEAAIEHGKVVDEFYDLKQHWSEEAQDRLAAAKAKNGGWIERGRLWEEMGPIVDCR